jgi:hypothetical protein
MTPPDEFDKEIEMASRGEWEALGLDAPDKFTPVSVDEFMES